MSSFARSPARNSKPELALIILVVVFVLLSICLGIWGYYGYAGQDKLQTAAKEKGDKATVAKNALEFYTLVAADLRLILGDRLSEDERTAWQVSRDQFSKDSSKFGNDKMRTAYLDLLSEAKDALGWDDEAGKYKQTWRDKVEALKKENDQLRASLLQKERAITDEAKNNQELNKKYNASTESSLKEIRDGAKAALDAAQQKRDEMVESFRRNNELLDALQKEKDANADRERLWLGEKETLTRLLDDRDARLKEQAGAARGARFTEPHALFMDVSMGKPLWDTPVGTVIGVKGDKVQIQVMSGEGLEERLKTKLTFNVFAGSYGKADRSLKGTIEVISLDGGRSATARITSAFGDKSNAIAEGDLLFNLVWGTHVAIAGQINLFGKYRGESQLEQENNLKHFLARMEDQGVIVDAYLDLTDGSVKGKYGAITPKTRFLIRGQDLDERKAIAAAVANAPNGGDEEKMRNLKDLALKRVTEINEKIKSMQREATESGVFIISPENFANVAGYRKLGGYGPDDILFKPGLPAANIR